MLSVAISNTSIVINDKTYQQSIIISRDIIFPIGLSVLLHL